MCLSWCVESVAEKPSPEAIWDGKLNWRKLSRGKTWIWSHPQNEYCKGEWLLSTMSIEEFERIAKRQKS